MLSLAAGACSLPASTAQAAIRAQPFCGVSPVIPPWAFSAQWDVSISCKGAAGPSSPHPGWRLNGVKPHSLTHSLTHALQYLMHLHQHGAQPADLACCPLAGTSHSVCRILHMDQEPWKAPSKVAACKRV
jgi:hypothetical protein